LDQSFVRLCSSKSGDDKGNKAFEETLKQEKVKAEVVQEGDTENTSKADADMAAIMEAFAKAQAEGGGASDEFLESKKEVPEEVIPEATEKVKEGSVAEEQSFQAETRQLLDIVTNSLYTDKEVFVRELVSNASDAMEKLRHLQATGAEVCNGDLDLDIAITCDANKNTLTLQDRGLGMTKEEMVSCIGTIARSGSKAFVKEMQDGGNGTGAAESIIGQFGVGFYSAFMVGEKLEVFSKSHKTDEPAHCWSSDGGGTYTIDEAEGVTRGTKIVIHLKEDCAEYAQKFRIEHILKKYSNFVNFPIKLQGEAVNTVQAIWTRSKVRALPHHRSLAH
jgi:HSP90 family molecular chaperone